MPETRSAPGRARGSADDVDAAGALMRALCDGRHDSIYFG